MTASAGCALPRRPLACQDEPDRWFNRSQRTEALTHCLQCPARRWCAQQALDHRASWGMWAGIWIDGRLDDVAHYLRAIAAEASAPADPAPAHPDNTAPAPPARPNRPAALASYAATTRHTAAGTDESRRQAVMEVIMARSSGHCEVMTPQCRYTLDTLASRIPDRSGWDAADASAAYAVCRQCQQVLAATDARLARRLGFLVDPPRRPGFVPIYWRQARWVYLDDGPTILAADPTDPICRPGRAPNRSA